MSYIGSTPTTQSFIAGTDSFNGTGSQTDFTLTRLVNSVNDVQVVVNNVVQYPPNYSVSGTTLTISPAPSSGTDNVYVRYLSTTLQSITVPSGSTVNGTFGVSANSSSDAFRITQTGTGNALVVEDSTNPDSTPFVIDSIGRVIDGATQSYETVVSASAASPSFQHHGTSSTSGSFGLYAWNASNCWMTFNKAGSGGLGNYASVNNGNAIGLIQFNGADGTNFVGAAQISAYVDGTPGTNDMPGRLVFSTTADGASSPTERMRLDSLGNLKFNSGYGSVATAYGCRAWVNFNGTGTVAIRASGNVSSITDNGTGQYTVNLTNALPDTNGSVAFSDGGDGGSPSVNRNVNGRFLTSSTISVASSSADTATPRDDAFISVTTFR